MAALLQRVLRQVPAGHHRHVRVQLVRPVDIFGTQHHDGVLVAGAAFGNHQVVPSCVAIQVRAFGVAERRAGKHGLTLRREGAGLGIERLHHDGVVRVAVVARPPRAVKVIFAAIVVVEQGRVEPTVAHRDRLAPRSLNGRRGDEEIAAVFPRRVDNFHVGIEQPEFAVGVAQARRPDAAGVRVALHVQHRHAVQRGADQRPVFQVAGVVDAHAREPLEGRGGDVVVLALTAQGRVRVEAGEYRVSNFHSASG